MIDVSPDLLPAADAEPRERCPDGACFVAPSPRFDGALQRVHTYTADRLAVCEVALGVTQLLTVCVLPYGLVRLALSFPGGVSLLFLTVLDWSQRTYTVSPIRLAGNGCHTA